MFSNFTGINFLGKLHNTRQHIQFIRWIDDQIEIPEVILPGFLTSYGLYNGSRNGMEPLDTNPLKLKNIRAEFSNCDYYVFEICSLKLYEKDGYQVQHELTDDYKSTAQSESELYNDLVVLRNLISADKPILFQTHFRPNIIYNDAAKTIVKREIIYDVISRFCHNNTNTYIYDPSIVIEGDHALFDGDTHFTSDGHLASFNYMYKNYLETRCP